MTRAFVFATVMLFVAACSDKNGKEDAGYAERMAQETAPGGEKPLTIFI